MTSPFKALGLSSDLVETLTEQGYTVPTAIQESSIPSLLEGRDLLGCAQTGTGKTASFLLPIIDQLAAGRKRARMPRAIVLEPTRELATQVMEAFKKLSKRSSLDAALIIGGESISAQEKALARGVDILISTPGRFLDLQKRGHFLLSSVSVFVLDEADRMLDMGFLPDIERIFSMLPATKQTILLSATISPEIKKLSQKFLTDPNIISIAAPSSVASTISQNKIIFPFAKTTPVGKRLEVKFQALLTLLKDHKVSRGIVFCNRKRDVDTLAKKLTALGFPSLALHGDLPQNKRTRTLNEFKTQKISLLIASDIAARGLDIDDMPNVFSFDVPSQAEDYVHRIGRTGRAGKAGHSFLFASRQDEKAVQAIEKLIRTPIPLMTLEGSDAACKSPPEASPDPDPSPKPPSQRKHQPRQKTTTPGPTPKGKKNQVETKEPTASPSALLGFGEDQPAFMIDTTSYFAAPATNSKPMQMRYGTVVKPTDKKDM